MANTPRTSDTMQRMMIRLRRWQHCTAQTAATALLLALAAAPRLSAAAELTIVRLFAAPDLAGDSLRAPRLSPNGKLAAYLKGAADNRDRLDLWAYDLNKRAHRQLIDARALVPDAGPLSAEEKARRERQRTSALSGILEYSFSPDSRQILVPLGGDLYLYDLTAPTDKAVRRLTRTSAYETDARFSPRGRYVSFIRDLNLVIIDLTTGTESAITTAGAGTVSHGTAEFIAQEEMNRDTGYWWAPDDSRLAYTRVDESTVAETERFEIDARNVTVVKQRYPFTGARNAMVELFVRALADNAAPVKVDLGTDPDFYLARVDFFPDGRTLAVQKQSRDQKTLDLLRADAFTGKTSVVLTERSDTWVPLHDELTFLPQRQQFVWASHRSGSAQLYLYGFDGHMIRQLTDEQLPAVGDRGRAAIRGVDEKRGLLYLASAGTNPRERQLYRIPLDHPQQRLQLTQGAGWHAVTMADNAATFLDQFSSIDTPPTLRLHAADGKLLNELVPNKLSTGHPYFEFTADHAPTEFGTLQARDGQALHYALIKPPRMEQGKRYPVVIDVYGGPGVQTVFNRWGGTWDGFHQILARAGYVVFMLDNRGSGERGVRFESASFRKLSAVEVEDQVAGVRHLRTLPFVNGERIGIMGWSYGGYMALMSVLRAPESFAAAVAGAPVTDWRLYDTHYTERYMGTPAENASGYAASDVLTYAANLQRPLLLIHGMADDNVLFTNSTALMRTLQNAHKPFELMTYPGGKHGLTRHQNDGPHVFRQIFTFFERNLKR